MKQRIGLYNLEPKIVNTAMMQLSTFHKSNNDIVEMYKPILHESYDIVYAFSLFDFTDKTLVRPDMICGGTGFTKKIDVKLPSGAEKCNYDWSLYPDCNYSILRFSTGCINNCKFCLVRKKEGYIKPVMPMNLNPNGEYIQVQDNNFFANPLWKEAITQLHTYNQPVSFQSIDARILSDEMCRALITFKHAKQIKIAWDNPKQDLVPILKRITKIIAPWKLMCYVLIGYDSTPEEDMYRVQTLQNLKISPFAMRYDRKDRYQLNFSRWVNHKAIFKSVKWEDYDEHRLPNKVLESRKIKAALGK